MLFYAPVICKDTTVPSALMKKLLHQSGKFPYAAANDTKIALY